MKSVNRYFLVFSVLLMANSVFSQNTSFDNVLKAYDAPESKEILVALQKIDTTKISDYDKATWLYYYADYNSINDKHDIAYTNLLKSKKIFASLNKDSDVKDCNILILGVLQNQNDLKINKGSILKELEDYASKNDDPQAMISVYHEIATQYFSTDNGDEALKYYRKIIDLYAIQKDTLRIAHASMNIGSVFSVVFNNPDSSLYYTQKAVPVLTKYNDLQNLAYNYNNQAQQYMLLKNYKKAIIYFTKADSIPLEKNVLKSKVIFYEYLAEAYQENEDYENAALYLNKLNQIKDSINDTQQNIAISEIKEQYDNEKLRADNLEIESKRTQNRNIAYGLGGGLFGVALIGFLLFKNTKRKQHIAEQQHEIEIQKTEKILKEQELTTIDAMISGQEKERERLAGDLHDSVGATLTAAKLQFDHLKNNKGKLINEDELFENTSALIEEAYAEVRKMAHIKNSGVMAKNGLLPAIEKLAKNASGTNNLTIEVQDFGLDERLENSMEIMIFRVIQELVTNIIKHSKASEASISITQHKDLLSIIVEDNGTGFDIKKMHAKDGMGLANIERRIEHLEGSMEVDSTIGKGTTVLIDIPL